MLAVDYVPAHVGEVDPAVTDQPVQRQHRVRPFLNLGIADRSVGVENPPIDDAGKSGGQRGQPLLRRLLFPILAQGQ
jgi:hypothetical protein